MPALLSAPNAFGVSTNGSAWLMQRWLKEDGLPNNQVTGLVQTPDGYLWIATPTALARFDGLHFQSFSPTNFAPPPNRGIVSMIGDGHGGLWLGMDRGAVVLLDGQRTKAFLPGRELPNWTPNSLLEDTAKSLWIAYRGGSVCRMNNGEATPSETEGLPTGNSACSLTLGRDGLLWFAKLGQIGVFRHGHWETVLRLEPHTTRVAPARSGGMWICSGDHLLRFKEGEKPQDVGTFMPDAPRRVQPTVMLEDQSGAVWIGTSFGGLFRFADGVFEKVPTSHPSIQCLIEDAEGSVWVGTDGGGLNQIRPRAVQLETTETGLPYMAVQSLAEDAEGAIWAATQNGALARRVGGRWLTIPPGEDFARDASCLCADPCGDVWVGTRNRGLLCWRTNGFFRPHGLTRTKGEGILSLLVTKNGDVWIGEVAPNAIERFHAGRLENFPVPQDVRSIRAVAEDASGTIWFGTSKGILLRVENDRLVDETQLMGGPLSIRCLYGTADGSLWIGYAGFGVGRLKKGRFTLISARQGLQDDYVSQILADKNGWLWFGGDSGIFKARQTEVDAVAEGRAARVHCVHYGSGEGLSGLQAISGTSPGALCTADGRLWMPMRTAVAVIDAEKLGENRSIPSALLTRVNVGEQTIARYWGPLPLTSVAALPSPFSPLPSSFVLALPPDHRRLQFEFTAPHFFGPENIHFRYKVENFDEDWIEAGTQREAAYTRLPAGKYRFLVAAGGNEGEWSESAAALALTVRPFFWQTWTFRLTSLAGFTGSIIAAVRYVSFRRLRRRLRQLEEQSALHQERARIAKDIHDDLGANLTQISLLGELAQQDRAAPEKAGEHIAKISVTARQLIKSLDEIVWAVNPSNDTLSHLLDYTGQFALDYLRVAGIRCRLDFPEQTPTLEVSTDVRHNLFLIVKEALHNIVKHAHATEVWLRAQLTQDTLRLSVEDNGCGFEGSPQQPGADGLRNMRQRAAEIGAQCRIESKAGAGTSVAVEWSWVRENAVKTPA